jgi:hypothetical protein
MDKAVSLYWVAQHLVNAAGQSAAAAAMGPGAPASESRGCLIFYGSGANASKSRAKSL